METLRAQGMKIGSCTGYTRPMVDVLAPAAAAQGYIPDAVVCSSDVPQGRPYPFMCYLNAIKLEAYPLEACLKIGDTVADIHEGLNAGMWTLAVARTSNDLGLTEEQVRALPADELKDRLDKVSRRFLDAGAHYVVDGIWDAPRIAEEINRRLADGERP